MGKPSAAKELLRRQAEQREARAPRVREKVKLSREESLAAQLMQARGVICQKNAAIAGLQQQLMEMASALERAENRALQVEFGFPDSFNLERGPDGEFYKVVDDVPPVSPAPDADAASSAPAAP